MIGSGRWSWPFHSFARRTGSSTTDRVTQWNAGHMKPVTQLIATTWTFSGKVNSIVLTITPPTGPHVSSFLALGDAGVGSRAPSNRRNVRQEPSTKATVHASATRTRSVRAPANRGVDDPDRRRRTEPGERRQPAERPDDLPAGGGAVHVRTLLRARLRFGPAASRRIALPRRGGVRDARHAVRLPPAPGDGAGAAERAGAAIRAGLGDRPRTSYATRSRAWSPTGRSFAGRRMSGQEVTSPLGIVLVARVRRDRASGTSRSD